MYLTDKLSREIVNLDAVLLGVKITHADPSSDLYDCYVDRLTLAIEASKRRDIAETRKWVNEANRYAI